MSTRVITVRDSRGSGGASLAAAVKQGAEAIQAGQLVGFATETVYGLAALATDRGAMKRLRKLKGRPDGPFSVHLAGPADAKKYVAHIPLRAAWLMERAWPGPVTILLDTGGKLADKKLHKTKGLYETLTADGSIGLRCPHEPVAEGMLSRVAGPVVAPSGNLPGEPSPRSARDVLHSLDGQIDLLIDSGPARYGKDSSIVRIDGSGWTLVRRGVYDERMLGRMMRRKIVFVCTGNTCRSPLAAAIAKKLLSERLGCRPGGLRSNGVEIISAGLFAMPGSRATPEAVHAARRRGADLARHKSRKLTADLIKSSDVIFCMTPFHQAEVKRLAGDIGAAVLLLDEKHQVADPIGADENVYDQTAEHIERAMLGRIAEGVF